MPEPHRDLASEVEVLPGLLTIVQLIPLLGISRTSLYDMVTRKRIPYLRIEGMIRFDPRAIAAWLRQHTIVAAA
jgi:excisionase family DNA binding protein